MIKVAVIGNGPAGVLAAYGALMEGAEVTVFHIGQPSTIHGAQYIHVELPNMPNLEPFSLKYIKFGTEEGYRQKIYGDAVPPGGTSWSRYGGTVMALPMHEIYAWLLAEVGQSCVQKVGLIDDLKVARLVDSYDYVLNTAPLPSIKPDGEYRSEEVWILADYAVMPMNEIWYIGDDSFKAYRMSNIQGHVSAEYPAQHLLPFGQRRKAFRILKPLSCRVELDGVHRLGRYGKWRKGVLAHEAFEEARLIIRERREWKQSLHP